MIKIWVGTWDMYFERNKCIKIFDDFKQDEICFLNLKITTNKNKWGNQ